MTINVNNVTAWAVVNRDGHTIGLYATRQEARINRLPYEDKIVRLIGKETVR